MNAEVHKSLKEYDIDELFVKERKFVSRPYANMLVSKQNIGDEPQVRKRDITKAI